MMILSLIVPVYKVEEYIEQCILSCSSIPMSVDEYEIIAINDGSPDSCLDILNSLCKQIPNLKVYTKSNGGLSSARNYGIEHATGKYLWFIDSDDYIESLNLTFDLKKTLLENNIDAISFNWVKCYDDGEVLENDNWAKLKLLENNITGYELFDRLCGMYFAPRFIFKRELFLINRFKEGIYFEDIQLIPRIVLSLKVCMAIPDIIYYYRQRKGSILSSYSPALVKDSLANAEYYFGLSAKTDCVDLVKHYNQLGMISYKCAYHYSAKINHLKLTKEVIACGKKNGVRNMYNKGERLYSILNFLYGVSPYLVYYLLIFYNKCLKIK